MDKINPDSPQYVYEQLASILEAKIRSGEYPPGTRLPGELAMTHHYGVGPGTVRRALAILRDAGLVVTRPARGSFVADEPPGQ
ncbi:GntR family transcriptional regulator [Streptomyces fragilis]|uniref:Winged helix-turn-helix domain-containing protein n=1 Tax=Streptomyces fragilis TaxID=67301 RepID=A0ABV2YFD7_9ACTN|nr:winged helix-turn-helix domain-containing protein [Streptomyces fragilis]